MKKLELTSFKMKGSDGIIWQDYANAVRYDNEPLDHTIDRVRAFLHREYPNCEIMGIQVGKTIDNSRFRMNDVARQSFILLYGTSDPFDLARLSDDDLLKVRMFGKKGISDLRHFVDRHTYKPQIEVKK